MAVRKLTSYLPPGSGPRRSDRGRSRPPQVQRVCSIHSRGPGAEVPEGVLGPRARRPLMPLLEDAAESPVDGPLKANSSSDLASPRTAQRTGTATRKWRGRSLRLRGHRPPSGSGRSRTVKGHRHCYHWRVQGRGGAPRPRTPEPHRLPSPCHNVISQALLWVRLSRRRERASTAPSNEPRIR